MPKTVDIDKQWTETTYGARWSNSPSPQKYQIWRMSCIHCDFEISPSSFRQYDETRAEHPQAYGNFASIAHARKVMREHVRNSHAVKTFNSKESLIL